MSWRASLAGVALAAVLSTSAAAAEKGGTGEGIKVHGHWTIEVRNPDGQLVSRDEFQNELSSGQMTLAALMGRLMSGLFWHLELHGPAPDNPCESGGQPVPCFLTEPSSPGVPAPHISRNLQVLVPTDSSGTPLGTVEMKGTITAARSTSIVLVRSGVTANVAGESGTIPFNRTFTRKQLPGKAVEAGQIVQVTVVFSFS